MPTQYNFWTQRFYMEELEAGFATGIQLSNANNLVLKVLTAKAGC